MIGILKLRKNNKNLCFQSDIKMLNYNCSQRAGIADGGEFYIRPPGTAAWLFDKVKY